MKKSYLIIISILGLITLAMYSTYAMFSATVETEDFVNLTASNIELDSQIVEYERITIKAKDSKIIDFNINNNTTSNLYYGTWYEMVIPNIINDDIIIAKYVNSEDDTFGLINSNSSKKVTLVVSNNTNSNITINIGVAYSKTSSLNLPINRELITGEYGNFNLSLMVRNGSVSGAVSLTNILPNSSFENTGWSGCSYNTTYKKYGSYSCSLTGTTATPEVLATNNTTINLNNTHTYYSRVEAYQTSKTGTQSWQTYWPIAEPSFGSVEFKEPNKWNLYSLIATRSSFGNGNQQLRFDYDNRNNNGTVYYDGGMLLDLTNSYGSNIPNKEELDKIPYFEGNISYKNEVVSSKSKTYTITPSSGYKLDKVVCDNTNNITISGNNVTINNLTSDTVCEVSMKTSNLDTSGANVPKLVDNMIPVMYYNNNWVKADTDNPNGTYKWYDYNSKQWANAVLVSSTNRNTYVNANAGTVIAESDVLAYYVWIPRYKYKVWNINKVIGTDSYNAQTTGIDIIFEQGTASTGNINCNNYSFASVSSFTRSETCSGSNGGYYTHPAFTFGDTELTGIWVGKFESASSNPSASYGGGNSTTLTIRIKPNVNTWRDNPVGNFYTVIKNMQANGNEYGLSSDTSKVDSHMLKNMEWGAVAYLTNSDYGRCTNGSCTEIGINNYYSGSGSSRQYRSGCGANPGSGSSSSCNAYNTSTGMLASTTGNIYGIYDMSGGAYEYVMGNMSSGSGSYTYNQSNAGNNFSYSSATAKYIDTYAYGTSSTNQTAMNKARLGDATGEVMLTANYNGAWYGDYSSFVYWSYPWFYRGGYYVDGSRAGVFFFYSYYDGDVGIKSSARAALLAL